jgi:hypothetical protein
MPSWVMKNFSCHPMVGVCQMVIEKNWSPLDTLALSDSNQKGGHVIFFRKSLSRAFQKNHMLPFYSDRKVSLTTKKGD